MDKELVHRFENLGVKVPEVLLPSKDVDMTKWSVVACDQYTSQPEYWKEVEKIVGNSPSALHLILPEIYLEETDTEERFRKIGQTMKEYIKENVLVSQKPGFIFVDRKTSHAESRKGLIIAVDLEKYDYNKGSQTLIRATEGTVIERLPPRIKIRQNASIELPHIMLLIDDAEKTVIEPLAAKVGNFEKVYDFDLMMGGEHIKGYMIDDEESFSSVLEALGRLADPVSFRARYGVGPDKGVLLFAVGDGNHSLASAKAYWENLKQNLSGDEISGHPARFALVEVVNVHDEGLQFEPIHRVIFNVDPGKVLDKAVKYFNTGGSEALYKVFESKEAMNDEIKTLGKNRICHVVPFISKEKTGVIIIRNPKYNLEVGTLQAFLDDLVKKDRNITIDYIHGEDVVTALGSKEGNMGFYLPPMDKHDLFETVILDGALPRKTFSMGEAEEKRFYLECRKISTGI